MHIRYKTAKLNMYNNSNGGVEHADTSKEDAGRAAKKGDVIKEDKVQDADGKEGFIEEVVQEEEEEEGEEEVETLEQTQGDAVEVEEVFTETLEKDDGEEAEDAEPSEEATDGNVSKDKQTEQELSEADPDDKKITIEILKPEDVKKEAAANVSREEKPAVELEMCRVCMGTDELSDIFQLEGPVRVSDIIMKVCTNIRITARDHLPHKICERCLGQVRIVHEFKNRCEASDKELRKNLKRSANKSRRQSDFIVVNCPMSDSDKDDDEPVDDDEYKVSQSEVESEPATSDDSFSPPNKRKRTPKRRGRIPGSGRRGRPGRKPKNMATSTPAVAPFTPKRGPGRPPKHPKTSSLSNIVYIEAPEDSSSSGDEEEVKRKRRKRGDNPCPKCDAVLPSQLALKQHLKTHPGDRFDCNRCSLFFRTERALANHIERHKKADRIREEKRKEREERIEQRTRYTPKSSDPERSKQNTPQGSSTVERKKKSDTSAVSSGRDLFKCVAPLTSTYWSDSFSD
ncbi:neurofilament heavy polypeptide [Anopheles marshallii]|uniref:neurofilament heavy polypeptide n=1 Tax=Anopheles marshallii TaxID=1521116 RepID=UPI00237AA0DD|nr:neurofilament heavy polypeptide [Anopheles marshallii]